jgi:hypothetical protein
MKKVSPPSISALFVWGGFCLTSIVSKTRFGRMINLVSPDAGKERIKAAKQPSRTP